MTITRRWQAGFETGNIREVDRNQAGVISTGQKNTGTYSLWFNARSGGDYAEVFIPTTRQVRGSFYQWVDTYGAWNTGNIFGLRSPAYTALAYIYWDNATQKTTNNFKWYINGAYGPTSTGPLGTSAWNHFAYDIKIDPTAGWFYLWVNGTLEVSTTGNTGDADISLLWLGTTSDTHHSPNNWYYDDAYIDDSTGESQPTSLDFPQGARFYYLTPNANGFYSQFDGSDGNSVDNYQLVDEVPPSDADYVQTATVNEYDSYGLTTYTLQDGEIVDAIIPIARAIRAESAEEIALGTRLSGTDVVGSGQIPKPAHYYYSERQVEKPGGGAWTQSDIDSVEMVIKSEGTF